MFIFPLIDQLVCC